MPNILTLEWLTRSRNDPANSSDVDSEIPDVSDESLIFAASVYLFATRNPFYVSLHNFTDRLHGTRGSIYTHAISADTDPHSYIQIVMVQ